MSRFLLPLLAILVAGGSGIVFIRLLLGWRERKRLLVLIAERIADATGGDGRELLDGDSLEEEIAHVLRAYRQAEVLAARVAELEAERVLARLAAKAELMPASEAPASESPASEAPVNGAPADEVLAGDAPAQGSSTDADDAATAEAVLILDQARRLTESSFVAGSDALVRVRAALKNLKDWRQRLGSVANSAAGGEGVAPAGANGDSAPGPLAAAAAAWQPATAAQPASAAAFAAVFASLSTDVVRLAECARALRPLAAATESMAGLRPGGGAGASRTVPTWDGPSSPGAAQRRHLLLATLRIRGLAAELETGLTGLGTELRVLGRLPVAKPVANDKERAARREGPEPAFIRTLSRLEMQLTEVATDIAGLTRDAEHLSRELKRIRLAANGRSVS